MIMAALNFIFSFLDTQSKIHAEPKCFLSILKDIWVLKCCISYDKLGFFFSEPVQTVQADLLFSVFALFSQN